MRFKITGLVLGLMLLLAVKQAALKSEAWRGCVVLLLLFDDGLGMQ